MSVKQWWTQDVLGSWVKKKKKKKGHQRTESGDSYHWKATRKTVFLNQLVTINNENICPGHRFESFGSTVVRTVCSASTVKQCNKSKPKPSG